MLRRDRLRKALSTLGHDASRKTETPSQDPKALPLEEILGGSWIQGELGPVYIKDTWFPLDHRHGEEPLGTLLSLPRELLSLVSREVDGPSLDRLGFFDTETTGVSGGTGTILFLACLGSFEKRGFRVRHYFLADLDGERAMLRALAADLESLEGIVTYNGRAFDVPLLESRSTLARLPRPCVNLPHFDLLHSVRRLFGRQLESCRLLAAEAHVLGFRRVDDVPSHLVPSIFFDYLRARRIAPLKGVFRHNAYDVLSMVGLLSSILRLFERVDLSPEESIGLGRWWELEHEPERAEILYRRVLEQLGPDADDRPVWRFAARRFARIRKRAGAQQEVVEIWRRLWHRGDRAAGVEIAKYLEHQARDVEGAASVTDALLNEASSLDRPEIEHRLARLRRKLEGRRRDR